MSLPIRYTPPTGERRGDSRYGSGTGYVARVLFWLFAYEFGWALLFMVGLTPR